MRATNVIMNDAIQCLTEKLGVVETEVFISTLLREPFDYTEWQKDKFDNEGLDSLCDKALKYCGDNPIVFKKDDEK